MKIKCFTPACFTPPPQKNGVEIKAILLLVQVLLWFTSPKRETVRAQISSRCEAVQLQRVAPVTAALKAPAPVTFQIAQFQQN